MMTIIDGCEYLTIDQFAEVLQVGAAAVDRVESCVECGAAPGGPCLDANGQEREVNHPHRSSAPAAVSFALREMARSARVIAKNFANS